MQSDSAYRPVEIRRSGASSRHPRRIPGLLGALTLLFCGFIAESTDAAERESEPPPHDSTNVTGVTGPVPPEKAEGVFDEAAYEAFRAEYGDATNRWAVTDRPFMEYRRWLLENITSDSAEARAAYAEEVGELPEDAAEKWIQRVLIWKQRASGTAHHARVTEDHLDMLMRAVRWNEWLDTFLQYAGDGERSTTLVVDRTELAFSVAFNLGRTDEVKSVVEELLEELEGTESAWRLHFALGSNAIGQRDRDAAGEHLDAAQRLLNEAGGQSRRLDEEVAFFQKFWPGETVPSFTVTDTEGTEVHLGDLRGELVLITFWASWCGPCGLDSPVIRELSDRYTDMGLRVIAVSLDRDEGPFHEMRHEYGTSTHHVFTGDAFRDELAMKYLIHSLPTHVIIDQRGDFVTRGLRAGQVRDAVETLLEAPKEQSRP